MTKTHNISFDIAKLKNLPPLPEESIKIVTAVNDPEISVEELVEVISRSPVLMARLLGLANSAFFGYTGKIIDLRRAIIQVLGLNLVKSLSLSIVLNVELDTSKCKMFDADYFWSHALATALIAQKLAVHFDDELMSPNVMYTSGLLLNIGLLAAIYIFPFEINEVFSNADRINGSVREQMLKNFGQTQYDMASILLKRWKLPNVYQTVVKQFRQPDFEGEEKDLVELLELSHWVASYFVLNKLEEMPDFSDSLNKLSLTQEDLDNVLNDVMKIKDNLKELAAIISG